jgi:predicted hydrolase (HD superfamily)
MAKALFACDELCGFLTAVAYVRPSKSIRDVPVQSVKKKLKDKSFAANVNREEVYQAAEEFGVPLDDHIAFLIAALGDNAAELGL